MLKEGSSIIDPVLIFERANIGHTYNYVSIPDFGRYYFVNDIVYDGARIYYHCSVDVLASFKSAIGSSSGYVLRAAHTYNEYVIDQYYPVTTRILQYSEDLGAPWLEYGQQSGSVSHGGVWVLGIVNGQGVTYYGFSKSSLASFMTYLYDDSFVCDILGITQQELNANKTLKAATDPIQYLTCLIWLPFSVTYTPTDVYVGDHQTAYQAWNISDGTMARTPIDWTPTIMPHPQSNARGEYLNSSGFTECRLVLPPFGIIELDPLEVNQYGTLKVQVNVDCSTGIGKLRVLGYAGTGINEQPLAILTTAQAQIGVPLPITQIITPGLSVVDMAMKIGGAIASAAAGNVMGAVAGGASAIDTYYQSKIPRTSTIGSRGSLASLKGNAYFEYTWKYVADDDNTDHGRPLCDVYQLSTLPGYQMILEPHIHTTGTASEDDQINAFLAGGYFYE